MEEYLDRIGWSQAEFARHCGVTARTVNNWVKEPPVLVMRYLRMIDLLLNDAFDVAEEIKHGQ